MSFEDHLTRALARTVADLQQRTTAIRERELEEALIAAYQDENLPGLISRQASVNLKGFRGVGNCDVAVVLKGEELPVLLELKWGVGTLYNCAWDAVKLALTLRERVAKEAYLVAGAPQADWDSEQHGVELFGVGEWTMRDFMSSYAREFAFWRRDVKPHPEILPERFAVSGVCQMDLRIANTSWSLRSARISTPQDGLVYIDENGAVKPQSGSSNYRPLLDLPHPEAHQ